MQIEALREIGKSASAALEEERQVSRSRIAQLQDFEADLSEKMTASETRLQKAEEQLKE